MTPQGQEIGIQHSPPLFALVGRIQEEVHRFAITYHHEKHSRSALVSRLDGIPGIGPVRRDALRKRFQTVRAIEAAELHELEDVLPQQAARAVYDHFHKGADTPEKQNRQSKTEVLRLMAETSVPVSRLLYSPKLLSIRLVRASTASFSSTPSAISDVVVPFTMPSDSTPRRLLALTRRSSFSTQMPLLNSLAF